MLAVLSAALAASALLLLLSVASRFLHLGSYFGYMTGPSSGKRGGGNVGGVGGGGRQAWPSSIRGIYSSSSSSSSRYSSNDSNNSSNKHSNNNNSSDRNVGDTFNESDTSSSGGRRRLSTEFNYFTGESMETFNGRVPKTTCPPGFYRPQGSTDMIMVSGQREDGCMPCPAGRYGAVAGLTSPLCTSGCPAGTFSDRVGIVSALDCQSCPVGKYGTYGGLSSRDCSGNCPAGRYTSTTGNIFKSDCKACPTGFRSWQCTWAVAPRTGQIQDHLKGGPFGLKPKQQDPLPQ